MMRRHLTDEGILDVQFAVSMAIAFLLFLFLKVIACV
jgi:hypothetical protein